VTSASGASPEGRIPGRRRILVAFDASSPVRGALEAALALAGEGSEIQGLFVEETNLLRLLDLPFVRETPFGFGAPRPLEVGRLEREIRARAAQARAALEAEALQRQIQSSFRVVRGVLATEVAAAAGQADLVVLDRRGAALGPGGFAPTARALLAGLNLPLYLTSGAPLRPPVRVLFDGSPGARRALSEGVWLDARLGGPLQVVLTAETAEQIEPLHRAAVDHLAALRFQPPVLWRSVVGREALLQTMAAPDGVWILSDGAHPPLGVESERLVEVAKAPLWVVR